MRVDTRRAIRAARADEDLQTAINVLRREMRREAVSFAVDALYDWVARGVETYHANRGWIFLLDDNDALRSIPGAAVRCPKQPISIPRRLRESSFMWRVLERKEGDFSNDVSKLSGGFYRCHGPTQSELAVPLFDEDGVEGGNVIGVYNLEADEQNTFFPAQVHELQRNVSLLTIHLLVVRDAWRRRSPNDEPWVWHPEPHGWSPGKLMRRFCRAVVQGAKPGDERQPICSVWNADWNDKPGRCWSLANSGLDYEFQARWMLPPESATARVAAGSAGGLRRGTPKNMCIYNLDKLRRIGVTHGYIAALQRPAELVRGTINLYAVDEKTVLPSEEGVVWLAGQAEDLLATVNRQRKAFAKAYVHGQLTKSATPAPSPVIFRRSVMRVLPADAMTTFIPEVAAATAAGDGPVNLKSIDTTGLIGLEDKDKPVNDKPDSAGATFPVLGGGRCEESLTAWCYVHAALPLRLNAPSDRTSGRYADLPAPSDSYPERVVYGDEDPDNRRRLGIAVTAPGGGPEVVGVIRMYRSSKGRPFTEADAELLAAVANSEKCRPLFRRWPPGPSKEESDPGPDFPPLSTILVRELRRALKEIVKEARAGRVYVLQGQAYQEFVCHPPHELPPQPPRIKPQHDATHGVTGSPDGSPGVQSWIKIFSWVGAHLMRTIVAFDFPDEVTARSHDHQVSRAARMIAVKLSDSDWKPDPIIGETDTMERVLSDYATYASAADELDIERRHRRDRKRGEDAGDGVDLPPPAVKPTIVKARLLSAEECLNLPWHAGPCPDTDLNDYGVTITPDGAHCVVPLRLADRFYTNLVCDLNSDHARALRQSMEAARDRLPPEAGVASPSAEDEGIWRRLRHNVGLVVGAWSRSAACFVAFKESEQGRDDPEANL